MASLGSSLGNNRASRRVLVGVRLSLVAARFLSCVFRGAAAADRRPIPAVRRLSPAPALAADLTQPAAHRPPRAAWSLAVVLATHHFGLDSPDACGRLGDRRLRVRHWFSVALGSCLLLVSLIGEWGFHNRRDISVLHGRASSRVLRRTPATLDRRADA